MGGYSKIMDWVYRWVLIDDTEVSFVERFKDYMLNLEELNRNLDEFGKSHKLCNWEEIISKHFRLMKHKVLYDDGKHQVIDDLDKGYAHIHPLPTQKELDDYYKDKFLSGIQNDPTLKVMKKIMIGGF